MSVAPIAVSPQEAAQILNVSRTTMYALLDKGEVDARYQGRKRLVSYASLQAYFDGLPKESG